MIYIASPYSHASPGITEIRYRQAEKAMAQMLKAGDVAYSPIAMTHHAARKFGLPSDSAWWRAHNYSMLRLASELRVLRIPGWHESKGVRDEIALAKHLNIPITWWDEHFDIWKEAKVDTSSGDFGIDTVDAIHINSQSGSVINNSGGI